MTKTELNALIEKARLRNEEIREAREKKPRFSLRTSLKNALKKRAERNEIELTSKLKARVDNADDDDDLRVIAAEFGLDPETGWFFPSEGKKKEDSGW